MPSFEIFRQQSAAYQETVLPRNVTKRISIEMESSFGWGSFVGLEGISIGVNDFGESGKGTDVETKYGFTVGNIVKEYEKLWNLSK